MSVVPADFERVVADALAEEAVHFSLAVSQPMAEVLKVVSVDMSLARSGLAARLRDKLELSKESLAALYAALAGQNLTFNLSEKRRIRTAADHSDRESLRTLLEEFGVGRDLASNLANDLPLTSDDEAFAAARKEMISPSRLRGKASREIAQDFIDALAGPLLWATAPQDELMNYFAGRPTALGLRGYLEFVGSLDDALMKRDRVLAVRKFAADDPGARLRLRAWLDNEFELLNNYGYAAFVIDRIREAPAGAWRTVLDGIFWAENIDPHPISQMFFRKERVRSETLAANAGIAEDIARFDLAYEGFSYRDTFVFAGEDGGVERTLVLLQKNVRDEEPLPCPSCRSADVEGNSYPDIGVKSWACRNALCPDRSLYNRGRRYQLKSIIAQAALDDVESKIPREVIKTWQRDVQPNRSIGEILEMLVRFFSIAGDGVVLSGEGLVLDRELGRTVLHATAEDRLDSIGDERLGAFFARIERSPEVADGPSRESDASKSASVEGIVLGESASVLASWQSELFDAAVTSPPYYNAREYSQWPNLYAYLRAMVDNAESVYRSLKPGAMYSYNIFDYFDNPNTIVFSDMGRTRLPLASYIAALFVRVGFELIGVDVWDKGHIHGKRGHNGGNRSPYYQSPFNCWEHIILFRKPGGLQVPARSRVLQIHPVVKMVRGTNLVGHTAPYPEELARSQLEDLPDGARVLDPYVGSGTTVVVAEQLGFAAVGVEQNAAYAEVAARNVYRARSERRGQLF